MKLVLTRYKRMDIVELNIRVYRNQPFEIPDKAFGQVIPEERRNEIINSLKLQGFVEYKEPKSKSDKAKGSE